MTAQLPTDDDPGDRHEANLVLVGLRGSGKTTLGRRLAERLGRPFVDLDDELERRTGRTVDELLAAEGEATFRQHERDVLAWAAGLAGSVIATGGGAVLHAEAMTSLSATGCVLHLDPPLELLVERARTRPRPPLTDLPPAAELARLHAERAPLYAAYADIRMGEQGLEPILAVILAWSASSRR